jgi:type VI secretion system protein ImpA
MPLVEHKRFGTVSFRTYLIGKGTVAPSEGETAVDLSSVEKILQEAELPILMERRQQAMELDTAVKQIRSIWMEKCSSGPSVSIERLTGTATEIFKVLNDAVVKRDPSAGLAVAADGEEQDGAAAPVTSGQVTSAAHAAGALAAIADYFGRSEPSNPALLLVRQAQNLLGKSFLEVVQLLIPDQVGQAAVNIGREQFFGLPIERLAAVGAQEQAVNQISPDGDGGPQFDAPTRNDALTLLDQVGIYFRAAEPSSPIPFFTDRARDLATRDFLSVLKALLPPDTLKTNL